MRCRYLAVLHVVVRSVDECVWLNGPQYSLTIDVQSERRVFREGHQVTISEVPRVRFEACIPFVRQEFDGRDVLIWYVVLDSLHNVLNDVQCFVKLGQSQGGDFDVLAKVPNVRYRPRRPGCQRECDGMGWRVDAHGLCVSGGNTFPQRTPCKRVVTSTSSPCRLFMNLIDGGYLMLLTSISATYYLQSIECRSRRKLFVPSY